jgi:cytosine/adenosine deaminase-related metal-dependent hydrolase
LKILIRAPYIVTHSGRVIENGSVVVRDGVIDGYFKGTPEGEFHKVIDLKGYLYPPFVNAHTHLELSNLSFNPDNFSSFLDWLIWIVGKRPLLTEIEIEEALRKAEKEILSSGTYYVGDISSFGISSKFTFKHVKISVFSEFIGKDFNPENFSFPVSAHSIYSVSFEALKRISKESLSKGFKFQMHLGETIEEEKFARCEENWFESRVYPLLGRKRYEQVCSDSIVDYINQAGALNENLIAVHCTNLSEKELDKLMEVGASIVLCPRSNIHLKVGFPNVKHLLGYERLGLGTDGLSSNINLSVVDELRLLYYFLKGTVSVKELFPLITISGAKVLGLEDYFREAVFTFSPSEELKLDPFSHLLDSKTEFKVITFREY